jgi:hypothetical protein
MNIYKYNEHKQYTEQSMICIMFFTANPVSKEKFFMASLETYQFSKAESI